MEVWLQLCVQLASFLRSMFSVCAARCEETKQMVVLCSWNRTAAPPLLPYSITKLISILAIYIVTK